LKPRNYTKLYKKFLIWCIFVFFRGSDLMTDYTTFEHDVLVVGAGGAGLRAAIEASAAGVKVGLI